MGPSGGGTGGMGPSGGGTGSMGPSGGGTGSMGPSGGGTAGMGPGGGGTAGMGPGGGGTAGMGPSGGGTAGMGTGGSGAGGADPNAIPPTFETLELIIMALGCDGSDCHGGNEFNPLSLVRDDSLYMNVTTFVSAKCENLPLVDPGNPDGSALIRVMTGPCGDLRQMPDGCIPGEGGGCVPDDYIAAVAQWITDGAPEE
jgi:hypothetical protein